MSDVKRYLQWFGNCRIGDKIYFVDMTFNGMFYLDLKDFSAHFVHSFSCAEADSVSLSFCSKVYDGVIYFFPTNTNAIMKYDTLRNQEQIIPIRDCNCEFFLTAATIQWQKLVYLFPFDLSLGIYVLNLENNFVMKDDSLSKLFGKGFYCANALLSQNNRVLIGLYGKNQIIEVNMETKKIVGNKKLGENTEIYTMYSEGNNCWILLINSADIYEWSRENDEIYVYTNENPIYMTEKSRMPYSNLVFCEDEILVLNSMLKNIFRINKKNNRIEYPIIFPDGFKRIDYGNGFYSMLGDYTLLEDKVLIYPCWGNQLLIYDRKTKQIEGKEVVISGRKIPHFEKAFYKNCQKEGVYMETADVMTLESLMIVTKKEERKRKIMKNREIGKIIYQQAHT